MTKVITMPPSTFQICYTIYWNKTDRFHSMKYVNAIKNIIAIHKLNLLLCMIATMDETPYGILIEYSKKVLEVGKI